MKPPALIVAVSLAAAAAAADVKTVSLFADPQLKALVQRLETSSDRFKNELSEALSGSVLNGTDLEDRIKHWAHLFEDEIDTAVREFHNSNEVRLNQRFENALMAATALNRAMLRRGFAADAEKQWTALRQDLNELARALGRPPLPDLTLITTVPAAVPALNRPEIKQVMDELEASADRFESKFDAARYTSIAGPQRAPFRRLAKDLEDAADQLAEAYSQKDTREYQFKLEESLMLAAGINRMMLASNTSSGPVLEWQTVRRLLNTLAREMGYPMLRSDEHRGRPTHREPHTGSDGVR